MSLNNIQKSNPKVLNRPMFRPQYALMKDGSIKPVTYAWYGVAASLANLGIKGGRLALPYMQRFGKKLIDPKLYQGIGAGARDYFKRQYVDPRKGFKKLWGGTGRVDPKDAKGLESIYGPLRTPMFNIRSKSIPNLALTTAAPYGAYKAGTSVYDWIKGDGKEEIETETETETIESSDRQPGIEKSN